MLNNYIKNEEEATEMWLDSRMLKMMRIMRNVHREMETKTFVLIRIKKRHIIRKEGLAEFDIHKAY